MSIIDPVSLQKMTAGDEELLADVAVIFVRLLPDLKARLRIGVEHQDAGEIETAAHQLKSRVSYFGATELQEIAIEIETAAQVSEFGNVTQLHDQMLEGLDQLIDELRSLTKLSLDVGDDS